MAKAKPRMVCEIVVERPPEGSAYRDDSFDVVCKAEGRQAGKMLMWRVKDRELPAGQGMQVANVSVEPSFRRRGLGTQMYEKAAGLACELFGLPLVSDVARRRSKYAESFWKKQGAKKRATCVGDSGSKRASCQRWALTCPAPESLAAPPHLEPVIQAAERDLVKFKTERGALFDEDGRLVLSKKGTKTRLKFTDDDVKLFPNRYFTHNHPPEDFGQFKAGSSLSPADVAVAAKYNQAEVRAVTTLPIDGKDRIVVYRIERPVGGWPPAWKIRDEADAVSARVRRQLTSDMHAKRRTHQDVAAAVMHETWIELAPKLGLKYDRFLLDGSDLGRAGRRRRRRRVNSR